MFKLRFKLYDDLYGQRYFEGVLKPRMSYEMYEYELRDVQQQLTLRVRVFTRARASLSRY